MKSVHHLWNSIAKKKTKTVSFGAWIWLSLYIHLSIYREYWAQWNVWSHEDAISQTQSTGHFTGQINCKEDKWLKGSQQSKRQKPEQSVTIGGLYLDLNPNKLFKNQMRKLEIWTLTGIANFSYVIMVMVFFRKSLPETHTEIQIKWHDI